MKTVKFHFTLELSAEKIGVPRLHDGTVFTPPNGEELARALQSDLQYRLDQNADVDVLAKVRFVK